MTLLISSPEPASPCPGAGLDPVPLKGKCPMSPSDSLSSPRVSGLMEEPEIQISPARGLPGMLVAGEPVTMTCTAPGRCSGTPPQVTWMGPFNDTAQNVSAELANGTWAHSSVFRFTPTLGDNGKELVCNITYYPPQGPSTRRTIRLHVSCSKDPGNTVIIGTACGLAGLIGLFLLGLCVIKLRGRESAPPSAEAGETANGSQAEHTANEASVSYSTITSMPMHHKTPAARRTKGDQDRAATAQAPEELHYASIEFSKPQRKAGEPSESLGMEYSEVRRK
ncbi:uncharacterized protein LOC122172850 [Chrysemys picta bellii]|uniref:uncharacterized protein LOC122172850 n=1 Tax=Chrysemys picta bellii TaxID=8478 RepID=UPI0032B10825